MARGIIVVERSNICESVSNAIQCLGVRSTNDLLLPLLIDRIAGFEDLVD